VLGIPPKQLQDLLHTQFTSIGLSTALDRLISQFAFLFLEVENPFFDGVFYGDFVDYDVFLLREAVDAVDSLFFDELRRD
jgi:hypothetical protein